MYIHTHPLPVLHYTQSGMFVVCMDACALRTCHPNAVCMYIHLLHPHSSIFLPCGCRTVVSASLSGINSLEYSFVENEDDIFLR